MKSVLIPVLLKYLLPAGDLSIRKNLWMLNLSSTSWRCIYFAHLNEGNGTPLQYSCLENCMDGGAWWAAVHGVAKSQTRLSDFTFTFTFHFHASEKEMATHSSVLAWRIPGMGEPSELPSMGSYRVRHDWSNLALPWIDPSPCIHMCVYICTSTNIIFFKHVFEEINSSEFTVLLH